MKKREITSMIQKVIPILVNSCDVPRECLLVDSATKRVTPKRGDIWVGATDIGKSSFEQSILLLIEVKDVSAKPLSNDRMYDCGESGELSIRPDFEQDFRTDLLSYTESGILTSPRKNDDWYDALVQAKYKADLQGLSFFAITNCVEIRFYHTATLLPIVITKDHDSHPVDFWIKYSLLKELHEGITEDTNEFSIDVVETVLDNPSEYEFQRFLKRIHNQNVFRFNDEIIIDSLLTFVFFKFLEEKIRASKQKLSAPCLLWSDFARDARQGTEGRMIIENMHQQLQRLSDSRGGYPKQYAEFATILVVPDELRETKSHAVVFEIWSEFSRYYFHGCEFDIYGSIYEEFASPKQKEKFGQYYTRRHISKALANLVLRGITDAPSGFRICDPACGSGGLLTECYAEMKNNILLRFGSISKDRTKKLSTEVFFGFDYEPENVEKSKLNMFFAGDGHNNISQADSIIRLPTILTRDDSEGYDVVVANPPYGNGSDYYRDHISWMNTKRHELVFIERMIKSLKYGGRFGFVVPDGVLENPKWEDFRRRLIEFVKIESIISVPVHAFAPYCAQKTYLVVGQRREYRDMRLLSKDPAVAPPAADSLSVRQRTVESLKETIWMYIIDFDGYANSNRRFPTDLSYVNEDGEIEFIHNDLFELREKYLQGTIIKYDSLDLDGTRLGDLRGDHYELVKAGTVVLNQDVNDDNWYALLPEKYLRNYSPNYISIADFESRLREIRKLLAAKSGK